MTNTMVYRKSSARHRWPLLVALLISLVGDEFAVIAATFSLAEQRAAGLMVGLMLLLQIGPRILLGRRLGRLVDRVGAWRVLRVVLPLEALAAGALVAAPDNAAVLLSGIAALAVLGTATQPAVLKLGSQIATNPQQLARTNALLEAVANASLLLGPALGGVVIELAGRRAVFLIDGFSFLVAFAVLGAMLPQRAPLAKAHPLDPQRRSEANRVSIYAFAPLRLALPAVYVAIAASSATSVAFVFLVEQHFGKGELTYGLLAAAWGLGALGAASLVARRGAGTLAPQRVTLLAAVVLGLSLAFAGLTTNVALVGVVWVLGGAANSLHNIAIRQLIFDSVHEEHRGEAFGQLGSHSNVFVLVGFVLGSGVAARWPALTYVVGGAVGSTIALVRLVSAVRHSPQLRKV